MAHFHALGLYNFCFRDQMVIILQNQNNHHVKAFFARSFPVSCPSVKRDRILAGDLKTKEQDYRHLVQFNIHGGENHFWDNVCLRMTQSLTESYPLWELFWVLRHFVDLAISNEEHACRITKNLPRPIFERATHEKERKEKKSGETIERWQKRENDFAKLPSIYIRITSWAPLPLSPRSLFAL